VKYEDSIERSAELLRKALPLMTRQAAGLHPVSYALWYDYVAQVNPALRAEVDERLTRDGQLDEASTLELFGRHVAELDTDTARRLAENFQRVLGDVARSAAQAGDQTERFGNSLSRLSQALEDTPDGDAQAVAVALADTRQMQASMQTLQDQLQSSQREISLLREEVRRTRNEALIDSLTGLANRRAFDEQLAARLAESAAGVTPPPCLVMVDIDHFKQINDKYGHGFGDQVLKAVSALMKNQTPDGALAARIGGEEFALLLPATDITAARALSESIRQRIGSARIRRQNSDQVLARVTVSLGVTWHQTDEPSQAFVDRADQALYASKHAGRDRVTVLPPG
jgi:diguanylate cyclase